jgi:type I restriction enzyme S subunit
LEVVTPGKIYRQIGVRLWGNGAYERETIEGSQTRYKALSCVEADDIVVNKIWARNGSVAVVSPELAGCYGSGEFPTFAPNRDWLHPRWFHWITKTKFFWSACDEKSQGTSGKNRIRPERFLEIEIPLPPLAEQRRIVGRIEELAGKVEEARGLRAAPAKEAQKVLNSAMRGIYDSDHHTKDWKLIPLGECCEAIIDYRGRTPPLSDEGIPYLTSANIKNWTINWTSTKYVTQAAYDEYMTRGLPKINDVIFTMEAPLGNAAIVANDRQFCLAQRVILLRASKNLIEGQFLAKILTFPIIRDAIYAKATGTTVKGIAAKRLKTIMLPIPPLDKQRRICSYLDDLKATVDLLSRLQMATQDELVALVPSILDQAFKGKL